MVLVISIIGILFLSVSIAHSFKRGIYVTIFNILAALAIFDIYVPAILGNLFGEYFSLPYEAPITDDEAFKAVIIANVSMFLLWLGYNANKRKRPHVKSGLYYINNKWLYIIYFTSVGVYFLSMYYDIKAVGSLADYYTFKLVRAYLVTIEERSAVASLLSLVSEVLGPFRLIALAVVLGNKEKFPSKMRTIIIVLTVLIFVLQLNRGSFLNLFICIIAIFEYNNSFSSNRQLLSRIKKLAVFGVAAFLLYGGIRTTLQNLNKEEVDAGVAKNMRTSLLNSTGNSLMAIVSSERYIREKPLFYGQSYGEMFLSFVPRSIMPNKPKIYGIETLNIAKGHPDTTMDSITMPGEAMMNFGYLGLILMFFWGLLFGWIDTAKYYPRMKYYLAATVFGIASTSSWMSFTGFFAQTKYILFIYFFLTLVIERRNIINYNKR